MRSLFVALLAASAAMTVVPAHAQNNELTILQSGNGNTLFVDQSRASGSVVQGLELGTGEITLGGSITPDDTARQLGGNNTAEVTVDGTGGNVYLYQNNTASTSSLRNTATINALNGGSALVAQDGTDNLATLTVNGSLTAPALMVGNQAVQGAIIQRGNGNIGAVTTGTDTDGLLVQNGSGNRAALDVSTSAPGTSVIFTQNGSNLTSATAAQVFTTAVGGTVSVTQTGIGSVTTQGAVSVTQTTR